MKSFVRAGICILSLTFLGCSIVNPAVVERFRSARQLQPPPPPAPPVILIPGMKGSVLVKSDKHGKKKTLWGNTRVVVFWKLDDLLMPLSEEPESAQQEVTGQEVRAEKILEDLRARSLLPIGLSIPIPVYKQLKEILLKGGGFVEGKNIFFYSYDWRRDIRVAAVGLADQLQAYRELYEKHIRDSYCALFDQPKTWQECKTYIKSVTNPELFNGDRIKFNVIAHSMGALVARYLIRGLGYGDEVFRMILVSPPNEGAMDTMEALLLGQYPFGKGRLLNYFYSREKTRPIIFSFPATFQLLPRYSAIRDGGGGILAPDLALSPHQPGEFSAAVDNWIKMFNMSPDDWRLICERSHLRRWTDCERGIRSHLETQLRSAYYFHRALRDGLDPQSPEQLSEASAEKSELIEYELKRIERAKKILGINQSVHVVRRHGIRSYPRKNYQFGGHCDLTLTYAVARKTGMDFCGDKVDLPSECADFGDKVVPFISVDDRRGLPDAQFTTVLLCADHLGITRLPTFQYNVLRILLEDHLQE